MKVNKEYVKQIILICSAFLLIFVGYYNYSLDIKLGENKDKLSETIIASERNEINLGDVQLVNADTAYENGAIVSNSELEEEEEDVETEINLNDKNNYFEETRLERTRMYSEMIDIYQNLIDSPETPQDQKAIAAKEISNINKTKNCIMISENLIKNKGFEDVVMLVNENIVSVVVKSYTLNTEQISKIQNIVERELNVEIKNISISNKY